jgi:hypothetical protein
MLKLSVKLIDSVNEYLVATAGCAHIGCAKINSGTPFQASALH